jgi:ribA/ribD-fused uncharacterized protein
MDKIASFHGRYRFLSNFFPSPFTSEYPEILETPGTFKFLTVEHAYQSSKPASPIERQTIYLAETPGIAKRTGRKVQARPGWDDMKVEVMRYFVEKKFEQNDSLRAMLLSTGSAELVEGNTWNDTFWGVCRGRGENHLGRILMDVRGRYSSSSLI